MVSPTACDLAGAFDRQGNHKATKVLTSAAVNDVKSSRRAEPGHPGMVERGPRRHAPRAAATGVSDAEVAEIDFVAFSSKKKTQQVDCRLVVRRVRRLQPKASDGTVQGELFAAYRRTAFITNSTLSAVADDGTATTRSSSKSSPN